MSHYSSNDYSYSASDYSCDQSVQDDLLCPDEVLTGTPCETVQTLNMPAYMGLWYHTAQYPAQNSNQWHASYYSSTGNKQMQISTTHYTMNPASADNGGCSLYNYLVSYNRQTEKSTATQTDPKCQGKWSHATNAGTHPYWIYATDYQNYSIVGAPDKSYLIILTRNSSPSTNEMNFLLNLAQSFSYNRSQIVPQTKFPTAVSSNYPTYSAGANTGLYGNAATAQNVNTLGGTNPTNIVGSQPGLANQAALGSQPGLANPAGFGPAGLGYQAGLAGPAGVGYQAGPASLGAQAGLANQAGLGYQAGIVGLGTQTVPAGAGIAGAGVADAGIAGAGLAGAGVAGTLGTQAGQAGNVGGKTNGNATKKKSTGWGKWF